MRVRCLEAVRRLRPELAPFVELWYNRASAYVYRDADGALHGIPANEGVEQGDPLAPVLFAYGMRDALAAAQAACDEVTNRVSEQAGGGCDAAHGARGAGEGPTRVRIFAFLDDVVICSPREVAAEAFQQVRRALHDLGLAVNFSKTHTWTPAGDCPPGALAPLWCPEGLVLLGGPLEDDHNSADQDETRCIADSTPGQSLSRGWFEKRVEKMRTDCELLQALAARAPGQFPALQIALQLLVFCVAPRADHLLRMVPPGVSGELAGSVDQLLLECTNQLFGFELDPARAAQIQWRLGDGGLGIRRRGGPHASAAWLASWAQCYEGVRRGTSWEITSLAEAAPGSLSDRIRRAAEDVRDHGARGAETLLDVGLWRSFARRPAPGLQRSLRHALETASRDAWWATVPTELAAMAGSGSGWCAGAALLRPPTERLLQLPDRDVRIAVCERLCVDLAGQQECEHVSRTGRRCGYLLRGGAHVHCCGGTAGVRTTRRHNPLVQEFARILSAAGHHVATEQRDPTMGPHARLDVVEYASDAGSPAAYDVSVVTPLRADGDFREACAAEPGLAALERHDYKLSRQYRGRLPGAALVPLVAEIGGRWHPSVPRLVRRLAKECEARSGAAASSGHFAAALTARWGARLSALVIRGNAAVHCKCRPAQPPDPRPWHAEAVPLPHLLPEGSCAFELLCLPQIPDLSMTVRARAGGGRLGGSARRAQ